MRSYYGKSKKDKPKDSPKKLSTQLEEVLEKPKEEWSLTELRALWPAVYSGMTRKGRSLAHETAWLVLGGYTLRPGYGDPEDKDRIEQLWKLASLGLAHPKEKSAMVQWWILWRRVAAGLDASQQENLFKKGEKHLNKPDAPHAEIFRALASFERVEGFERVKLGERILAAAKKEKATEAMLWSLGRIANRLPLQGTEPISPTLAYKWFESLSPLDWTQGSNRFLTGTFRLAARVSPIEAHNLSPAQRKEIREKLRQSGIEDLAPLETYTPLQQSDAEALLGEALPAGLRLE